MKKKEAEPKTGGPEIECPKCKKKFLYYSSSFRPFCSERCRQADLGHWLTEGYVIHRTVGPEGFKESDEEDEFEQEEKLGDQGDDESE